MRNKKFTKEEIENIIKESSSIADVCRKCGWLPKGDNYKTVRRYIKEYDIDTSHFNPHATNINNRLKSIPVKSLNEILTIDSYYQSNNLKLRLIKENIKEYKCEKCGISEWNNEQIGLQLHHINGENTDNRIENLILLCPNCHSQTDNYCGKKNEGKKDKKFYCNNCGESILKTVTGYCNGCFKLLIKKEIETASFNKMSCKTVVGSCIECEKVLYHENDNGLCRECFLKKAKMSSKKCDKETLEQLTKEKSFLEIGRIFGVSDNTIRKWCKSYDLPFRKRYIIK